MSILTRLQRDSIYNLKDYDPKKRRKKKPPKKRDLLTKLRQVSKAQQAAPSVYDAWFQPLYTPYMHKHDVYRQVIRYRHIAYLSNTPKNYIILLEYPKPDSKKSIKERFFKKNGYQVFYVKVFDQASFDAMLKEVLELQKAPLTIKKV